MQFQFRAGDKGASSYVPPSPSAPHYTTQSFIGNLWSATEDMGSERRVRKELLAAQATMRHDIEAGLRRELMIERELAIIRGGAGFSFLFEQPITTLLQRWGFEEGLKVMTRALHHVLLPGFKDSEILAFMSGLEGGVHGNSTVTKPLPNDGVPPMAMPVGIKRKAEVAGGDQASSSSKKKKTENKWTCPLCQVSATCERGLQDHFRGKKHEAKEASLKKSEEMSQKICRPDPFPDGDEGKSQVREKQKDKKFWCPICEISTNNQALMEMHWNGKKHMAKLRKKSGTLMAISSPDDAQDIGKTTATGEDASPSNAERTEEIEAQEDMCKGDKLLPNIRQTNLKFWCQTCKIGTTSEDLMKKHQNGKKHMAKLKKNSGTLMAISSLPDDAQEVGETTATEEAASPSNAEGNEEIEAQEDMTEEQDKLLVNKKQTNLKFWCETCKIGTTSEDLMKEHQNGKKHMTLLRKNGGALITISILPDNVENDGETTTKKKMNDSTANADKNKETEVDDEIKWKQDGNNENCSVEWGKQHQLTGLFK